MRHVILWVTVRWWAGALQGWLPGKGYGFFRRFIIIFIILAICLAVSLGAPFDSAEVGALLSASQPSLRNLTEITVCILFSHSACII